MELDPARLNVMKVPIEVVVQKLAARNLNVPGGNVTYGQTEYLIRSLGEYRSISEIENTVIRSSSFGETILLKDLARVSDRRAEPTILSLMGGKPSMTFSISKAAESNLNDVIGDVKRVVEKTKECVPDGLFFSWTNDNSVYIDRIVNVLRNNAITGMVLILLVLNLFLGRRNALLAALGIPISFFITFILMDAFGYSLNGSTLFALVMVLGIIVDDAVIVIENCHRHRLISPHFYR